MRRHRPLEVGLDEVREPREPRNPEADAARRESTRQVRRLVAGLPPRYRDALTLFYSQEMDIAAAAASLGIPQGTLKARLHRARKRLAKQLRSEARGLQPETAR